MSEQTDITLSSVQQAFEQAFLTGKKIPVSITLSEADYNAFCESIFSKHEYSAFERDLLGESVVADLEQRRTAYQRQRVTHILCGVNGGMIPILFSQHMPSGKMYIEWERASLISRPLNLDLQVIVRKCGI